jgi:hypothetical protein
LKLFPDTPKSKAALPARFAAPSVCRISTELVFSRQLLSCEVTDLIAKTLRTGDMRAAVSAHSFASAPPKKLKAELVTSDPEFKAAEKEIKITPPRLI